MIKILNFIMNYSKQKNTDLTGFSDISVQKEIYMYKYQLYPQKELSLYNSIQSS